MSSAIKKVKCDCKNDKEKDCMKCEPKHPIPKDILFECSPSSGSKTFSRPDQSFTAACVTLDTTCICDPKVKIEFSSVVTLNIDTTSRVEVRLKFELFKVCDDRPELLCGTWVYEKILPGPVAEFLLNTTDSFSFIFCECQTCPGCCQYFVRVTADSLNDILIARVSDGSIVAIAV
ncbi:DUF4489 domain-containing protein [Wukongibacter baidiensis]|uniref:DUF4489 domain-containing protein n=1 Tax=Wukongibacter baidiensis TaxID=1723361 RepID=UPI003D7F7B0B